MNIKDYRKLYFEEYFSRHENDDERHRIFVYGSLKNGYGNNRIITESPYNNNSLIDVTITKNHDWHMVDLGYFPGVVSGDSHIKGELWEIDTPTLYKVDMLEGNGSLYTRELVELEGHETPAWMYVFCSHRFALHRNENQENVKSTLNQQTRKMIHDWQR